MRLQRKLIILKQSHQNVKNKSDVVIYGILYHHIKKPLYLRVEMTLRFFSCHSCDRPPANTTMVSRVCCYFYN